MDIPEELFLILTREVPEGLRLEPDCLKACREVLSDLATPTDIEAVCIHEVGHYIYTVAFGIVIGFKEEQIEMHAPRVLHYLENEENKFEPIPGSVESPFKSDRIRWTPQIVTHLARIAIAGGVFAGKFYNRSEKGTKGDIGLFRTYYRMAHKELYADAGFLEFNEYLEEAKEFVLAQLETIPLMEQVARQKAEDYKFNHFVPFLSHSVRDTKNDEGLRGTQSN